MSDASIVTTSTALNYVTLIRFEHVSEMEFFVNSTAQNAILIAGIRLGVGGVMQMQAMGHKRRRLCRPAQQMRAIPLVCKDLYTFSSRWQLLSAK